MEKPIESINKLVRQNMIKGRKAHSLRLPKYVTAKSTVNDVEIKPMGHLESLDNKLLYP
jgi:hypothetical protein